MKHNIEKPNLSAIFYAQSAEDQREERYLAFEAEFDINRPFEVEWSSDDKYLIYQGGIYFYKPQYEQLQDAESFKQLLDLEHQSAVFEVETPHFYEYRL